METTKFNLYQDDEPKSSFQTNTDDEFPVTIDLERDSISEMIQKVRNYTLDKPNDYNFKLYIVAGFTVKPDIELFIDYLNRLEVNFQIFIRGLIHPSFVHILNFPNVFLEQKVRLIYKTDELHLLMKNLMKEPKTFRTFIQRFIDEYNRQISDFYLDVTELKTIGFNFETF